MFKKGFSNKKAKEQHAEPIQDFEGYTLLTLQEFKFNAGEPQRGEKPSVVNGSHFKLFSTFDCVDGKERVAITVLPFNFDEDDSLVKFLLAVGYCSQGEIEPFVNMDEDSYSTEIQNIREFLKRLDPRKCHQLGIVPFGEFKAKVKFSYDSYNAQHWTATRANDCESESFWGDDSGDVSLDEMVKEKTPVTE